MSEALYHDAIMARAKAGQGDSRLDPHDARAIVDNPLCGDRVTFDLRHDGAHIVAAGHRTRGCALCQAAAETLRLCLPGATTAAARAGRAAVSAFLETGAALQGVWRDFEIFAPVRDHPSRQGCVLLAFEALDAALAGNGSEPA